MTVAYAIIRNAPAPAPVKLYPFEDLRVGDAFDCPRDKGRYPCGRDRRQASLIALAHRWSARTGWKFTVRVLDPHTIRVHRIA